MEVTSVAEELLFTTVRIEASIPSGECIGTGFILVSFLTSGAEKGSLTFIRSDGQRPLLGESYSLEINEFEKMWFGHK
jgi:hypothetical protein